MGKPASFHAYTVNKQAATSRTFSHKATVILPMKSKLTFKQKVHIQIWASFLCIAALVAAVAIYAEQETLPQGVRLGHWTVSGMPITQFQTVFADSLQHLNEQEVVFHTPYDIAPPLHTTFGKLGLKSNREQIERIVSKLKEGTIFQRAVHRWHLRKRNLHVSLLMDAEQLEKSVSSHWRSMLSAQPVNAVRTVEIGDVVKLIPDRPAFRIDTVQLQSELDRALYNNFYAQVDKKLHSSAKNPLSIELPLKTLVPRVTVEELEAQGVSKKLIQFSTPLKDGGAGKLHNIRSTAAVVHDTLLAPDEVFDYSKIVESTRAKYGYREAPVILNGKLVPGIGGGICQVSTTLYNAAIRIGLDIVERRNHSLPISYAPLGQDATFSTGYINFRFRNSLDSHLLVRTEVQNGLVTVKMFGTMSEDVKYNIRSRIVEKIAPPVQYVHNPKLAKGQQVVLTKGKEGYIVKTFRDRVEKGKQMETEELSRDHYIAVPRIIAVNDPSLARDKEKRAPKKQIIEDGVSAPHFTDDLLDV